MTKPEMVQVVMDILAKYGDEEPAIYSSDTLVLTGSEWGKLASEIVEALCPNS